HGARGLVAGSGARRQRHGRNGHGRGHPAHAYPLRRPGGRQVRPSRPAEREARGLRRPRGRLEGELRHHLQAGRPARRRGRRLARRGGRRLRAERTAGRPDRQDHRPGAVRRGRHQRRDPAPHRDQGRRHHRRDQQGRRRADLRSGRHRPGRRPVRDPARAGKGAGRVKSARALPPLVRAALVLLAALGFALLAWSLDRRMLGVAQEAYFGFRPVLSNALPGLLLALVLAALTRRPLFSLLVVTGLQALLYRIGTLKLQVLQDPIGVQDLYFVTNLSPDSFSLLAAYVEKPLWLLAGVVAVGSIAGLAWWLERPAFRAFRWVHAILAVVALSLCATLFIAAQPWTGVYSKQALNPSRFKAMSGILHAGLMSNLVYSHIQNRRALDTLDEAALRRLLDTVDIQTHPVARDAVRPDIVVILSES